MSGVWERMRASEVAAQRYLRTNASVLEWFAVAVHFTARESGLLLATCVALYAGRWSWALRALLAMSLGEMLNGLLKFATHEPRPVWREDVAQSPFAHARRTWEDDYSFPSSHAQVMLGLAVSFQHLVPDRPRLVAAAYALALAAGVTRAYLGQHYLHDVVAGWLVELVFVVPYWHGIDALLTAPVPVVVAVAACLFFFPLLLELAKLLRPLESDAQVRKWEQHARAKTGCKNKSLHPLNTGKYFMQAVASTGAFVALAVAVHYDHLDVLDCACTQNTAAQRAVVFLLRFAIGVPALVLLLIPKGFTGVRCVLNIGYVLCAVAGFLLVPYAVERLTRIHCVC